MRALTDRSRPGTTATLLLAAALSASVAACVEIKDGPSTTTADSAAGAVARTPAQPPRPSTAAIGPDSVTWIRGGVLSTPEALAALQTDTAQGLTEIDTTIFAATTTEPAVVTRGGFALPVQGIPAEALRDTYTEKRGGARMHEALDIAAPRGTPVLSVTGGRVLKLFDSKAGGLMVYAADSAEQLILMYAHLDAYAPGLAEGQPLKRGQVIGTVGTTGNAPPNLPHLHFAVARSANVKDWWKGAPINPFPLLVPQPTGAQQPKQP